MDIEELLNKLKQIEEEKQNILNENDKLKKLLQNYNDSRKNYYEKNKEIIKAKAKQGLKKLADENPDKLKEYRRNAYLKRKEKLIKLENHKEENI
jgi:DNA repair ATPase RecN